MRLEFRCARCGRSLGAYEGEDFVLAPLYVVRGRPVAALCRACFRQLEGAEEVKKR
jgi:ribosomal protein S14